MKKSLFLSLFAATAISVSAAVGDTFDIDHFIYTVTDDINMTVSVKYDPYSTDDCPSNIVIPSTITGSDNEEYTVTAVAAQGFHSKKGIKSVSLPATITEIGVSGFSSCESLTEITVPEGVSEIADYVFYNCVALKKISLPASVTKIGLSSFSCCTAMSSITLPPALEEISSDAFSSCGALTTITLPASMKQIGVGVFEDSRALTTMYSLAVVPPSAGFDLGFDEYKNYPTLYVPKGSLDAYKSAKAWKNFPDIQELSGVTVNLSKTKLELYEGDEELLQPTINGAEGLTIVSKTWSSSNPSVAMVDEDGYVTAVGGGTAVVTYTVVVNENEVQVPYSASCKVTVTEAYVEEPEIEMYISPYTSTIEMGETLNLTAEVLNFSDATIVKSTWSSSDTTVATVEGDAEKAVVTGVKGGDVTITLTVIAKVGSKQFKFEAFANVTVKNGQPQTVETKELTVVVKDQSKMTYSVVAGQSVIIALEPAEGFKVSSVTFNDEVLDVTDNSITTPAIDADSQINVEYAWAEEIKFGYTTGVDKVNGCDFRVYRDNDDIVIENVETYSQVNVFTVSGVKIASTVSNEIDVVRIRIVPGVYIITINGTAIKVNL